MIAVSASSRESDLAWRKGKYLRVVVWEVDGMFSTASRRSDGEIVASMGHWTPQSTIFGRTTGVCWVADEVALAVEGRLAATI